MEPEFEIWNLKFQITTSTLLLPTYQKQGALTVAVVLLAPTTVTRSSTSTID